jgi:AcrR family transcriptional regulator
LTASRIRRTAEEARRVILDAAEEAMRRSGPGGLRLHDVAERAGVSHPTILHHFESRDGLVRALNRRTVDEMGAVLRAQLESPAAADGGAVSAAFAAYRSGFAQRIVWVMQSGEATPDPAPGLGLFDDLIDQLHALRLQFAPPGRRPDRSDSAAIVHLVTIAAFGDAMLGPLLRRSASAADEAAARAGFEAWLAALIATHTARFGDSSA